MIRHFITRIASEQPREYENRVAKLLEELEQQGVEWTETPALRGCYLSVRGNLDKPVAYIEYPK